MITKIDEAVSYLRAKTTLAPRAGVILGSGLGALADSVDAELILPYSEIPGAKPSAVIGHSGRLIIGCIEGMPVVVLQGRIHFYEGHTMEEVMFLSRVIGRLGIRELIVTNAAGAVNTSYSVGDLMLISDHINFMGINPLRGPNVDELGPRFPDLSEAYSVALRDKARAEAGKLGIKVQEGVYLALSGPSYETPAEIRAFRVLGADAVGMSTVPEALAMAHMGIPVLGISCITNMGVGILPQKLHHDEVMEATQRVSKQFVDLVLGVLRTSE